jgi:hypothetical protein
VEQAADQRRFAVIDRAAGEHAQQPLPGGSIRQGGNFRMSGRSPRHQK